MTEKLASTSRDSELALTNAIIRKPNGGFDFVFDCYLEDEAAALKYAREKYDKEQRNLKK
jgi:hypothetical protein